MDEISPLPIGKLPFANQIKLVNELDDIICSRKQEKIRGILYNVPGGSGFTRFLEYSFEKKLEKSIKVYVDASSNEDDIILVEFFHAIKKFYTSPSSRGKQYIRERVRNIIDIAVSSYSDFEGPGSNTLLKLGEVLGGSIRSLTFDRFRNIIDKLPEDLSVIFMIDNVHDNQSTVKDFIKKTATEHYNQVFYVMGYSSSKNETHDVFLNEVLDFGINVVDKDFPAPDENLVKEILLMTNNNASKSLIKKILKECNHNLHKIISRLRKGSKNKKIKISDVSKSILLYLHCSRQSLSKDTIKKLIILDPAVYIDEDTLWLERSMEEIAEYIHINSDCLIQLVAPLPFMASSVEKIRHSDNLYNDCLKQFSHKNVSPKLLSLLFHLSKSVDSSKTALYSQEIVRHSLYTGNLETAGKYYQVQKNKYTMEEWDNYILNLCFLISSKRYLESLDLIESDVPAEFSRNTLTLILKAIAMNRVRRHEDSIALIKSLLLDEKISLEQKALLTSFHIGGLIHSGQKAKAYKVYKDNDRSLVKAKNYGYFIRNAAGACSLEEAVILSKKSISIFKDLGDDYGLNTSKNNLGAYLSMQGNYKSAVEFFIDSKSYLCSIGLIHLEEVYVNLGLIQLYSGSLEKSESTIKRVVRFSSDNVPKYYALQILALLYAIQGKSAESLELLKEGYQMAMDIEVQAHRERYFANAALISGYCNYNEEMTRFYRDKAENSLYLYGKDKALAILNLLSRKDINRSSLVEYFIPPFMFYWSQEPIFFLDSACSP